MIENIGYGKIKKSVKAIDQVYMNKFDLLISSIIKQNPYHIVQVFEFSKSDLSYYYIMEELNPIDNIDKEIIQRFRSIKHRFHKKDTSKQNIEYISETIEKANPKLVRFLNNLVKENRYWDLHKNNIRINSYGDYKIIDIEGFIKPNYDNWIISDLKWIEYE